ncbi:MAG TPA: hypothetical protein VJT50_06685 [Pyrinomonadaceae bacterium]|nr:hypothetical protein [Pyrinomonadaceae bacterium]
MGAYVAISKYVPEGQIDNWQSTIGKLLPHALRQGVLTSLLAIVKMLWLKLLELLAEPT